MPLIQYWKLLSKYFWQQWLMVTFLAFLLLTSIFVQLVNPVVLRFFIDAATINNSTGVLTQAALLFLGLAIINQIVSVLETYVAESLGWNATNRLRSDLAYHCLRLDMSFHNHKTPGELIERIDGDVLNLANFFSRFVINVIGNLLLLLGMVWVLFTIDWRMGAVFTIMAALIMVALHFTRSLGDLHWGRVRQTSAEYFGFLEERLAGTEDIKANGALGYLMYRFFTLSQNSFKAEKKATFFGVLSWVNTVILFSAATAVSFVLSAWLLDQNIITLGTVFLIYNYTSYLRRPVEQLTQQLQDLQKARANIKRINELFNTPILIKDKPPVKKHSAKISPPLLLPGGALAVHFQSVGFGYSDTEKLIDNFSFNLEPGEVLGLIGHTGSGKTTITRLISRLYEIESGSIRLGEIELSQLSLAELRSRVSVVTQEVQLFQASIRDNLTFFDHSISDAQILKAIEDLGLSEWYKRLAIGLDTELAAGGGALSAGEAQLLAFTRIFLTDPGLIILDEASSRLDPATEQLLEGAIEKLLRGRTAIIVAHRLASLGYCDKIMLLNKGQIEEQGVRTELAANQSSHFHHLLQIGLDEVLV